MEVEGLAHGKDFKLYPGEGREWDWSEPEDVEELLDRGATVVVLSRGMQLQLHVDSRTLKLLNDRGMAVHFAETTQAVEIYKELAATQRVGGLFHSTC